MMLDISIFPPSISWMMRAAALLPPSVGRMTHAYPVKTHTHYI
jgi:hypothetical protein